MISVPRKTKFAVLAKSRSKRINPVRLYETALCRFSQQRIICTREKTILGYLGIAVIEFVHLVGGQPVFQARAAKGVQDFFFKCFRIGFTPEAHAEQPVEVARGPVR